MKRYAKESYLFAIKNRLEKEGPIYPISLAFSKDSTCFIAYSNKATVFVRKVLFPKVIVETQGLSLKTVTLSELKENEWVHNQAKYPLAKSKGELMVPFCTGLFFLFTADATGHLISWKPFDDPVEMIGDSYHIHANQITSMSTSLDNTNLYTMSGSDSIICQWESYLLQ